MTFTTFIYFFGTVCFDVAITTLVFVAVDAIEKPCKQKHKRKEA